MYLSKDEQKIYNKAIKYAEKLYEVAKTERNTNGYRENLGYDSRNKLVDKIDRLGIENYQTRCIILRYYEILCDSL